MGRLPNFVDDQYYRFRTVLVRGLRGDQLSLFKPSAPHSSLSCGFIISRINVVITFEN